MQRERIYFKVRKLYLVKFRLGVRAGTVDEGGGDECMFFIKPNRKLSSN